MGQEKVNFFKGKKKLPWLVREKKRKSSKVGKIRKENQLLTFIYLKKSSLAALGIISISNIVSISISLKMIFFQKYVFAYTVDKPVLTII